MNTKDYSLTGKDSLRAVEVGLAEADWYQTPLPRAEMRELLQRSNGPALRDTALLVTLLVGTAYAFTVLWGSWWAVLPYMVYAVLYGTSMDSRWHECSHGTAFKSDWMNTLLYELASFMVMRESVVWRWSHTRHHSDTVIVGRDPEIQIPRPTKLKPLVLGIFAIGVYQTYFPALFAHARGRMTEGEKTYVPQTEFSKVYRNARLVVLIYASFIASAVILQSWIPLFLFILPQFFGTWLMIIHNTTQHAGLAENVLDHRLNCRTVYMNPISRFIYWNMNYHVEHHMFPLVPYHTLPKLHEAIKSDCPLPYSSILNAWLEILPAILRQRHEPDYIVERVLPKPQKVEETNIKRSDAKLDAEGWLEVFDSGELVKEDAMRFDHGNKTFAIYRDGKGKLYATDGVCTHGNTHLADGLVKDKVIECSKHNGRFNMKDGSPARAPICRGLATYPVEEHNGRVRLNVVLAGGEAARNQKTYALRVVSNKNVATFIKELVLEPVSDKVAFTPGDYIQLDIPRYEKIHFKDYDIHAPYADVWSEQGLFDLTVGHQDIGRRNNYSLASNSATEQQLKLNVRIATPPVGKNVPPGVGSSYVFNLKAGDELTAIGSFGDFHIKPTQKEMVYIGGGAGMAPIRAHIAHLFETEGTSRKVSYWYGARSKQEIFYNDYFQSMADRYPNFDFNIALSEPLDEDKWTGPVGYIHEVALELYLKHHANPQALEFYLCGPPMMLESCKKMFATLGVYEDQISFDEF